MTVSTSCDVMKPVFWYMLCGMMMMVMMKVMKVSSTGLRAAPPPPGASAGEDHGSDELAPAQFHSEISRALRAHAHTHTAHTQQQNSRQHAKHLQNEH